MRKLLLPGLLLLGGCAAIPPIGQPSMPASQKAVVSLELEYVDKFLAPATAYTLLPRCPQPEHRACSDPTEVARLHDAQVKVHNAIYAARDFTNAAPAADASALLASARTELTSAEAMLPHAGANP